MALLLASEEMNRRQADELSLLRSGGRAPSPAAADLAPGPVAGGDVARLEARLAEQQQLIRVNIPVLVVKENDIKPAIIDPRAGERYKVREQGVIGIVEMQPIGFHMSS
jgi:hypothetical protein